MKRIYLHLNSRDEFLRVDISKIVYFEADGNYTNIILSNNLKGVVCMNLSKMQQVLTDRLKEQAAIFIRVGKSYIINRTYVCQINVLRQDLLLSDGQNFVFHLNISRDALKKLKELSILSYNIQSETENGQSFNGAELK